jgi:radical SAM family uncharacterized protein
MKIEELLYKLENPQVYTGREINAVHHPVDDIRAKKYINVCLIFPDKYEIGMSHQGLIILYHLLNNMPAVNAERCFLPGKPSITTFKEANVPLFSLESKTPLKDFDLIGFSLLSEMNYTNILQILDLAQIPLLSKDREEQNPFPLIAAGGISVVNPEPIRDFIDIFGIGDGEDLFPEMIEIIKAARNTKPSRLSLLKQFDNLESIYVPALYPPVKKGRFYGPDLKPGSIKKRVKLNLDDYCTPKEGTANQDSWIVPLVNVVFDRLTVEIARGCPKNCRFCQAKSYYAPYRIRSLESTARHIASGLQATGFECFSLSSLSAGDYPHLTKLLETIPEVIPDGVSFSLPSLRPSTLSDHLLTTIARYKRTGITIVPEAGTERLRNVINKDVTDEEIFNAVNLALKNRWQKIKLYFMLGLPTETMSDIEGIVQLIQKVMSMAKTVKRKISIHVSFSPFVPKAQTPLQWAGRESLEGISAKMDFIKQALKPFGRRLDLDIHVPHNSMVETILARGDYRVGELLLKAFNKGEIFSAWDRDFNYKLWHEMIAGTIYEEFLTPFAVDDPLPWDFLQINFNKEYLQMEYRNALAGLPTPSCDQMDCAICQGCSHKMKRHKKNINSAPINPDEETNNKELTNVDTMQYTKVRLFYKKIGEFTFFSHLSMMKYLERLIRLAGIRFECTRGFTSRIKLSCLPALPVFASGLEEVVEIFIDDAFSAEEILNLLKQAAEPEGFIITRAIKWPCQRSLTKDIHLIHFIIEIDDLAPHMPAIHEVLADWDSIRQEGNLLHLSIDYSRQGQERFAKIYKIIDPDKVRTMYLSRTGVTFKEQLIQ